MKKVYNRALLLLLAVLLVLPLAACKSEGSPQTIIIEEDPAYSEETLLWAEETILLLVRDTYSNMVTDKISPTIEARLQKWAHGICQITAANPIPEQKYRMAITTLAQNWQGALDELLALRAGEGSSYEQIRKLYLELTYAFGAERIASMLYDGCLLIYDMNYETAMERFESLSYPHLKLEAEEIAQEKAIFTNGVQKEAFVTLIKCVTATAELLATPTEGLANTFSDTEVLEMIRRIDPSKIDISAEGWEVLLSRLSAPKSSTYATQLVDAFKQNGDISRVSAVMDDAVALWTSVLQKLTHEDIAAIRAGERDVLLHSAFSHFDEADWALFTTVTSIALENDTYSAFAQTQYGEAYTEYVSGLAKIDIEQLRESVDSECFYQNLLQYLAGICPAIAYEVNA